MLDYVTIGSNVSMMFELSEQRKKNIQYKLVFAIISLLHTV